MPSRLEDTPQKVMWGDEHWARLDGSHAHVEIADDNAYLALSIRNAGVGDRRHPGDGTWACRGFATTTRMQSPMSSDPSCAILYVPGGDAGFWQARDPRSATTPSTPLSSGRSREPRVFGN